MYRDENEQLKSERQDLGDAIVKVNIENRKLRKKCKKQKSFIKGLTAEKQKLISFNKKLALQNKQLNEEQECLNGEYEVLSADIENLFRENTLAQINVSLVDEKNDLEIQNKELGRAIKGLVLKNEALKKDNRALTVKIEAFINEKNVVVAQKEAFAAAKEHLAKRNKMLTEQIECLNARSLDPGQVSQCVRGTSGEQPTKHRYS